MRFHFCLPSQPALNPTLPAEQTPRQSVHLHFPRSRQPGNQGSGISNKLTGKPFFPACASAPGSQTLYLAPFTAVS